MKNLPHQSYNYNSAEERYKPKLNDFHYIFSSWWTIKKTANQNPPTSKSWAFKAADKRTAAVLSITAIIIFILIVLRLNESFQKSFFGLWTIKSYDSQSEALTKKPARAYYNRHYPAIVWLVIFLVLVLRVNRIFCLKCKLFNNIILFIELLGVLLIEHGIS